MMLRRVYDECMYLSGCRGGCSRHGMEPAAAGCSNVFLSLELALLAFFWGGGRRGGGIETREGSKSSQKFANLSLPLAGNCYGNVISEKAICRLHLRGPLVFS